MAKVRKRTGELEEFDRRKLEESVRRAGGSPEVAKRISQRVQPEDEITSEELRRRVADELNRESASLSGAYLSTEMLRTRYSSDLGAGIARVHEDLLKRQGARSGAHVFMRHKGREAEVKVESDPKLNPREILVNRSDLEKLGAQEGVRLDVRFSK